MTSGAPAAGTEPGPPRPTTPVGAWADALARHAPPAMDPGVERLVVVAAHPDDETLAAAGFLRAVHASGGTVTVVVATDGDAAFGPPSAALARTRRAELDQALAELGVPAAAVHRLGLPDSRLARVEDELAEALVPLLDGVEACLAPWTGDPHPDHAAAGRAALRATPAGTHRWAYPVWALPWRRPDDPEVPWAEAAVFVLDDAARAAKRRAVAAFASQLGPAPGGRPPIVPPDVLAHFDAGRELFFRVPPSASAPVARFTALYAADADPWGVRTRWYERRKRDVLLACLPRERYGHVAEPGCGLGVLTAQLARRCGRVTASDPSAGAAAAARAATAGLPGVTVGAAALPGPAALPEGTDLVVLSEVLYYLAPADVDAVADRIAAAAAPGADVVLAHWRGRPAEAPQDAAATHRRLTGDPRFRTLVEHRDEEFLLHVLRRR